MSIAGVGTGSRQGTLALFQQKFAKADSFNTDGGTVKLDDSGPETLVTETSANGYCGDRNGTDNFQNSTMDWVEMMMRMRKDYSDAGIMNQFQEGNQILQMMAKFIGMATGDPVPVGESAADDSMQGVLQAASGDSPLGNGAKGILDLKIAGKDPGTFPYRYMVDEKFGTFPYQKMAEDGSNIINYNGVIFTGDPKTNSICLGDMGDYNNILNIPLQGGGCLKVNRDNLDDLSKAMGMFCPEDRKRIMEAIITDKMARERQRELEEESAGVGDSTEKALDGKNTAPQGTADASKTKSSDSQADKSPAPGIAESLHVKSGTNSRSSYDASAAERRELWYDLLFADTAEGVKKAWKAAREKVGMDGSGFDGTGKATHISQIMIDRLLGDFKDQGGVLGSTLESACAYAAHACERLDEELARNDKPNAQAREYARRERQFYQEFMNQLMNF